MATKEADFPTPELDKIDSILNDFYACDDDILIETGKKPNGKDFTMQVEVFGNPKLGYSIYRFDNPESAHPLLPFMYTSRIHGVNKMCDYILFIEKEQKLFIVAVELKLKSTTDVAQGAKEQLAAGKCLVDFIEGTLERVKLPVEKEIQYRYVLITEPTKGKTRTDKKSFDADNFREMGVNQLVLSTITK